MTYLEGGIMKKILALLLIVGVTQPIQYTYVDQLPKYLHLLIKKQYKGDTKVLFATMDDMYSTVFSTSKLQVKIQSVLDEGYASLEGKAKNLSKDIITKLFFESSSWKNIRREMELLQYETLREMHEAVINEIMPEASKIDKQKEVVLLQSFADKIIQAKINKLEQDIISSAIQ
jgi:hypothetical protein